MVRFLCFNAPIHTHKPKETAQRSVSATRQKSEDYSQVQSSKQSIMSVASGRGEVTQISGNVKHIEQCQKSENHSRETRSVFVKSLSMPVIDTSADSRGGCSIYSVSQSRFSEDLQILDMNQHEIRAQEFGEERESTKSNTENNNYENSNHNFSDSYDNSSIAKDRTVPVIDDEGITVRNIQDKLSVHQGNELPGKEFKIKRIEEWIDSIQNGGSLEETSESLHIQDEINDEDKDVLNGPSALKADTKVSPGMEAAKRYISTISATASSAQLSNLGLDVIPLLSAFASLRVLNLSGNAIVRVTAGALPRGLHVLNLSKNKISTIEGLRELTRLRVLDLSFNRITRIGHGLNSCSSLKELYLAGNKIREPDGHHRLLKLTVLDLRYNKISTPKCLDQLAANYNSLQTISLEGNPAQKNVGDEQLKKHLHSLFPHLAFYNRQPTKVGSLKDFADRAIRFGTTASQFDQGLRSDHRYIRKSSRNSLSQKRSSFSSFGTRNHSAVSPPKPSKGKRVALPPRGTDQRYYSGYGTRQLNLKPDLLMPRSRSEGTLGAP